MGPVNLGIFIFVFNILEILLSPTLYLI